MRMVTLKLCCARATGLHATRELRLKDVEWLRMRPCFQTSCFRVWETLLPWIGGSSCLDGAANNLLTVPLIATIPVSYIRVSSAYSPGRRGVGVVSRDKVLRSYRTNLYAKASFSGENQIALGNTNKVSWRNIMKIFENSIRDNYRLTFFGVIRAPFKIWHLPTFLIFSHIFSHVFSHILSFLTSFLTFSPGYSAWNTHLSLK